MAQTLIYGFDLKVTIITLSISYKTDSLVLLYTALVGVTSNDINIVQPLGQLALCFYLFGATSQTWR